MNLKPITPESVERFTGLVIGESGIGKTSLLRTIPAEEKVCVLSAESGLLCVRDLVQSGKIEGFEIGSFEDMREAYNYFRKEENKIRHQWIFIDSLTEIANRCVDAMKRKHINAKDTFKLWGEYADLMTMMIKSFRDMKEYSVIFTCLPSVEKDENNCRFIGPAMAGKGLKEMLTSYFDEVFYMTVSEDEESKNERIMITQPVGRYPAKDRSGKLNQIEKPDLNHIKNKIMKG